MRHLSWLLMLAATIAVDAAGSPARVTFSAVATPVPVGQPFEVTVTVDAPTTTDCDAEVRVTADFTHEDERQPVRVDGFCDSDDGSVFRVRFSPTRPGEYVWRVTYRQGEFERVGRGSLTAVARDR